MSGKLNEFIRLFVADSNAPSCRADQRWIELKSAFWPSRSSLFHGTLNPRKNQLAGRTAFARSSLMQPAVEIARNVDRGTNGGRLHIVIVDGRLK